MENSFEGIVTKSTGSFYSVLDTATRQTVRCRIRGVLRLEGIRTTNPAVVGDRVRVEFEDTGEGVIAEVLPRRNYIIRRSSNLSHEAHVIAANIDTAYLVVTLQQPRTTPEFIDRFLVTAEAYHIPAVILLNKADLLAPGEADEFIAIYAQAGYEVVRIAALTGEGIDALRERMQGRTSLLSGNSGVGKSTLISALDPALKPRTGEISAYHQRGKHTTTFSEIFQFGDSGLIIDTPGIKGFGLVDIAPEEIARYFPDLFRFAPQCRFYNCTHAHEPGCAVTDAVERGEISASRYESYLKMLEDDGKYR